MAAKDSAYKSVLFDFDGTLTPSLGFWAEAFHFAFAKFGITASAEIIVTKCFYRPFEDVAAEFQIQDLALFDKSVREGLVLAFENAKLFPSIAELLDRCHQAGIALGVVTSNTRNLVHKTLAQLKVHKYFDVVICYEDCERLKPFPDPIFMALEKLKCKPEESLFVGDSAADILAGKAAGTHTALFVPEVNREHIRPDTLESNPDFVYSHHDELEKHLAVALGGRFKDFA